jgi:hypothetical protein
LQINNNQGSGRHVNRRQQAGGNETRMRDSRGNLPAGLL